MNNDKILNGKTHKIVTGCGNLYVTVNKNANNKAVRILVSMGKAGTCVNSLLNALIDICNLSLDAGVNIKDIIHILTNVSCQNSIWNNNIYIKSCVDALSIILKTEE